MQTGERYNLNLICDKFAKTKEIYKGTNSFSQHYRYLRLPLVSNIKYIGVLLDLNLSYSYI